MKNKLFPFLDQILVSGGNFLTVLLCANLLSLPDQGNIIISLSLYMAALLFSIAFVYAGIPVLSHKVKDVAGYNYTISVFHSVLSVVFIIVFLALYPLLLRFFDFTVELHEYAMLLLFIFFQQYADFARRSSYVSTPSGKTAFLFSLITYAPRVGALYFIQTPSLFLVFATLAATAFFPFLMTALTILKGKWQQHLSLNRNDFKEHLAFSTHIVQSVPIVWFTSYLPIFFLGAFNGAKAVAIVGTLRNLTNLANVFVEIIEVSQITKWVILEKDHKTAQVNQEITRVILLFLGGWGGILAIFLFGIDYFSYFLHGPYLKFQSILIILWFAYLAYFFSRIYMLKLRTLNNTRFEKQFAIAACIVALPASAMAYWFGVYGAALAYLSASLIPLIYFGVFHHQYAIYKKQVI